MRSWTAGLFLFPAARASSADAGKGYDENWAVDWKVAREPRLLARVDAAR